MNDDTLTLYYYRDGLTDPERRNVEAELRADAMLAARYEALCRELDRLGQLDDSAAPPHAVARWHDSIERAARSEWIDARRSTTWFHLPSFVWGTAVTAALAIGVGIGVLISGGEIADPIPTTGVIDTGGDAPTAFSRSLKVYLRDSQQEIAGLSLDRSADRALLIMHIIEQNRLFERAAEQNSAPELARVLRAFEPILERLAADDIAPEDAEALRAQLAFELNVMLTKLAREPSDETHSI